MNHGVNSSGSVSEQGKRVVVAMSGGVDSSVAAALLVKRGFEVIGIMMRLWSEPGAGATGRNNRCCTPDQMADARRVALQLDIPFYVIDVQTQFRQKVVQFFIDGHNSGRTPNPCVECNRQIRFDFLLNHALALGADYLATGHYARIHRCGRQFQLLKGVDAHKDQSYVLHVLRQEQLAHTLFPVGEYRKEEVRLLAAGLNLPVASKRESQDLCFLSDGDHRRFLREYKASAVNPGPILNTAGEELGWHDGLSFYTIGQRKGLGISAPSPLFVIKKDVTRNALIVGALNELGRSHLAVEQLNWVSGAPPDGTCRVQVKIRAQAKPSWATLAANGEKRFSVEFEDPVAGVTPGQSAVFYDGEICLGGGIICDD